MSSHHAKNKINISASFVDTLNCSLFVQRKATMWIVIIVCVCVVTLSMWIRKEDRRENVIYIEQLINLAVVSLDMNPHRHKSTFFPHSACYIDVTSHLLLSSTVSGNIILLNQIWILIWVKAAVHTFPELFGPCFSCTFNIFFTLFFFTATSIPHVDVFQVKQLDFFSTLQPYCFWEKNVNSVLTSWTKFLLEKGQLMI